MKLAYTFDDVLLVPRYSNVLPRDVDISTQLGAQLGLKIPLLSAAMDTVTEHNLAKSLARLGGLGIIHKNMSIEEQAAQVDRVKRTENGIIENPVTISPGKTVQYADSLMRDFKIGGLPVVDEGGKLLGLLTNRDIRFEENPQRPVQELMTPLEKLVLAHPGIDLVEAKKTLHKHKVEKLPIVDAQNRILGLITIKDINAVVQFPHAARDGKNRLLVGGATGPGEDGFQRAARLIEAGVDVLVVDTAHGHSENVLQQVRKIRAEWPETFVIAGNVATAEGTAALIEAGANAVKVGIGPGSICTTRVVAGVGVPQLSAVEECFQVAKEKGVPLVADGGIRFSGDIVKALAAGASAVMLGSIFAGTEEAPGEAVLYEGRKYKTYRGMGSIASMKRGSKDRYFQSEQETEKLVPEGVEGMVAYKGNMQDIVHQLCGGIRSGFGYCGAKDIPSLQKDHIFVRVTTAGRLESHPHDVVMTQEAPNYSIQQ